MIADLRNAFAFLTILPLGYAEQRPPGQSFAYFPLVGLVIGLILVFVRGVVSQRLPDEIAAFALLLVWVVITGGLHLDGFADSCDGLIVTADPERRLEIMKDPRTGSWAVIGLILLMLGKWTALLGAVPAALVIAPLTGRWMMVVAAYGFPYRRASGLGAYFRAGMRRWQLYAASVLAGGIVFFGVIFINFNILIWFLLASVGAFVIAFWANQRLGGGLTGDVYGALCELTEWSVLIVASIFP
jgi:adenosylcobinamide-GDP ribazoletransferase